MYASLHTIIATCQIPQLHKDVEGKAIQQTTNDEVCAVAL